MARGGRRAGTKGALYSNRTDLRTGPLPVTAPRGLPYGDRAKLVAAQRAVPMGTPGVPAPVAGGSPPPGPAPGQLPFTHPSERPNEPVTAGLPMGPGPGPEALSLGQRPGDPLVSAVAALNALGPTADTQTAALRDAMNATLSNRGVP